MTTLTHSRVGVIRVTLIIVAAFLILAGIVTSVELATNHPAKCVPADPQSQACIIARIHAAGGTTG